MWCSSIFHMFPQLRWFTKPSCHWFPSTSDGTPRRHLRLVRFESVAPCLGRHGLRGDAGVVSHRSISDSEGIVKAIWPKKQSQSQSLWHRSGLSSPDLPLKSNKLDPLPFGPTLGLQLENSSPLYRACLDISLYHLYEVDVVVLPLWSILGSPESDSTQPTQPDMIVAEMRLSENGGTTDKLVGTDDNPVGTDDHHFPIYHFWVNINIPWPKYDVDLLLMENTKTFVSCPLDRNSALFLSLMKASDFRTGGDWRGLDWFVCGKLWPEPMAIYQIVIRLSCRFLMVLPWILGPKK